MALTITTLPLLSQAKDKSKESWVNKGHCHSFLPYEGPNVLLKANISVIGVDIGPNGELIRMGLKDDVLADLPETLSLSEHSDIITKMSRKSFEKDTQNWGDWYETPLDIGWIGDGTFIYVLLPETWSYSDQPISLKTKAQRWKHPHLKLPVKGLTDKVALMHRAGQNYKTGQDCLYEFNLNVTITQKEGRRRFQADIIIDPGTRGNDRP